MRRISIVICCVLVLTSRAALAGPQWALGENLRPYLEVLNGEAKEFTLTVDVKFGVGEKPQTGRIILSHEASGAFSFVLEHEKYAVTFIRDARHTELALPLKGVRFVGEGDIAGEDTLDPATLLDRLIGEGTSAHTYFGLIRQVKGPQAASALIKLAGLENDNGEIRSPKWNPALHIELGNLLHDGHSITVDTGTTVVRVSYDDHATPPPAVTGLKDHPVQRAELERLVFRGMRRALEVVAPASSLTNPAHIARVVPHGELRWEGDQRLVLLSGSPKQIGTAHGQLLGPEAKRCLDSSVYLVGLAATVDRGAWFPDELREAYRRLESHIPQDYKDETDALADAVGVTRDEGRLSNVFPELFHCSGFALFGKATVDGKLYHGRVLDYMTEIGLQDCATTFIIAPTGKIPFANVGYAGFIGSVSGMNAKQISLGEMGGRGQGQWDGVPMSTLMRRAMEECSTLDQVKQLWATSPRTCEYYYVFADGKIPDAVACAATPQRCDFLKPGEAHDLLGDGIPDAVVLSAGDRLLELRKRVREGYGTFDAAKATTLMCRPVAMKSNLHDVLFVPQDGIFYVANADHKLPAAERPYVKYDLTKLLASMTREAETAAK